MSRLACPLCGRFVNIKGFDPSDFELDIYAMNRVGLGRAKRAEGPRLWRIP